MSATTATIQTTKHEAVSVAIQAGQTTLGKATKALPVAQKWLAKESQWATKVGLGCQFDLAQDQGYWFVVLTHRKGCC